VRGTKLIAWRIPSVWKNLQEKNLQIPEGSRVPKDQEKMLRSTEKVLNSIAQDVRGGLLETVGIESSISFDDNRCSMRLKLPDGTDTGLIARAIDAENIEAWCDKHHNVHVAINPWYSTKDVDQTVLCTIKVIHVLLGIHASDSAAPKTLKQRVLTSIAEIVQLQQKNNKNR
jgi:hypothetical protein